jgi:pilus assembly protein CpaC
MHRTRRIVKLAVWGLLTSGLATGYTAAQAPVADPPVANINSNSAPAGRAVIVAINGTATLTMSTKKPLRTAYNEKETVARVQALTSDNSTVLVVGLQAGSTRIKLTDVNGVEENYDVIVQLDIDAVKSVIRLMFPTANVTPIAAGTGTIVLTGNVAHPEDIEPILRVARGVLGTQGNGVTEVYDAMTVGGVRQVQLDVTIALVNRKDERLRNLNFIVNGTTISAGSILPPALIQTTQAQQQQQQGGAGVGIIPSPLIASPQTTANVIFGIVPSNFNLLLQALRNEGLAKLLSEPRLITMSGHPADFLAGAQQAVLSPSSGINGPGVTFQDVGTALRFLPIVQSNGRIFLEVEPVIRTVDNGFGINTTFGFTPGFNVQRVHTQITMDAGQTFAIGGLIQTSVQASTSKLPFLGDLPFVGTAFSSVSYQTQEQELVVVVTPYLVDPMDCKQAPCKLPGMETRKPDDFELFLETILEAPRGQRDVFAGKKYVPAYKNDPTACKYPCGGDRGGCDGGGCQNGNCGNGNCATGQCGTGIAPATTAPAAPAAMPK